MSSLDLWIIALFAVDIAIYTILWVVLSKKSKLEKHIIASITTSVMALPFSLLVIIVFWVDGMLDMGTLIISIAFPVIMYFVGGYYFKLMQPKFQKIIDKTTKIREERKKEK